MQFVCEVVQAVEVRLHTDQLALRLLLTPTVFQHASGFLNEGTPILRLGFENLCQAPLPDDDVHLPADTRIAEQLLDVHETCLGAVNLVFAGTITEHAPGDGDLGVFDRQSAIGVIDRQRHLRAPQRLALACAREDHVLHLATTQCLSGVLTHDPGQSVHDVGLT